MNYLWMDNYILSKKGVVKERKDEWAADLYRILDKMFVMVGTDKSGAPIVTLKLEPADGNEMRARYPEDIAPGYYMNKIHWNSIRIDGPVPDDELRRMLDESYRLVLGSLSKKAQRAVLER